MICWISNALILWLLIVLCSFVEHKKQQLQAENEVPVLQTERDQEQQANDPPVSAETKLRPASAVAEVNSTAEDKKRCGCGCHRRGPRIIFINNGDNSDDTGKKGGGGAKPAPKAPEMAPEVRRDWQISRPPLEQSLAAPAVADDAASAAEPGMAESPPLDPPQQMPPPQQQQPPRQRLPSQWRPPGPPLYAPAGSPAAPAQATGARQQVARRKSHVRVRIEGGGQPRKAQYKTIKVGGRKPAVVARRARSGGVAVQLLPNVDREANGTTLPSPCGATSTNESCPNPRLNSSITQ